MERTGSGVEVRDKSIRFRFLPGKPTWMLDGKPAPPTPANVKRALRMAAEIRERIKYGTFSMAEYFPVSCVTIGGLTVAAQLDTWLGAQRVAASTKAGYGSAARFWKTGAECDDVGARLGDLPLRALKLSHIKTACARAKVSGKTLNNYMSVLREALQLAVDDNVLHENPAATKTLRAKHQRDPPDPFSRDEAEAIIADMAEHHPGPVANLVAWWFFTGARTSEVFGLRWGNVDLRSGRVTIAEALVRGVRKSTKTDTARHVILNSRAMAALKRQAEHTRLAGAEVWQDPRYDKPWADERAFRRSYWTPTLKRLGVRYRRPYQMRHTYATMMLMAGMTPAFCAKQLGHSVEMFLRTYSKWLNGAQDALEMQRLEQALSANSSLECPQESPKR
jgi:integrase